MSNERHLLVFGGTGLVGSNVCKTALKEGWKVTSISRRGAPEEGTEAHSLEGVDWKSCDATNARAVLLLMREIKPTAIVHCIGVLFDSESWLASLNPYMSGCSSKPDPKKGTYENIIKNTAMSAFHAVALLNRSELPFVFVSVSEVGWLTGDLGILGTIVGKLTKAIPFLSEYLFRKREVEDAMLYGIGVPEICKRRGNAARPIVMRPSLVMTDTAARHCWPLLFSLSPVNDGPVHAKDLSKSILRLIDDPSQRGIFRRRAIRELAART
eukprot:TRINITY_DN4230_c0_g1_i1.p2 TRINITY_DN4230_c0_g1~~TRINITY_DN4230_c0_g1_i1.p2  ORF type:complete len:289 (+),score=38.64 TRINITY_DN4230_c0_g1_i1:63-869(+)